MSGSREFDSHPSAEEYDGYYNVPGQFKDGSPILCTRDDLQEWSFPEFWKVYKTAERWLAGHLADPPGTPFDPVADPPFFVRSDTDDRTLCIDVTLEYLSPALLFQFQREVLGRFPAWRALLIAECAANTIVVYPNAIRFGNLPADIDPDESLSILVRRARTIREDRQRPRRKYVEWLRRRLPHAVLEIGDTNCLLMEVLAENEGDTSRLTVSLLIRGSDSLAVDLEYPEGADKEFWWRSSFYGVDDSGSIISYIEIPKHAAYHVALWLPPADYRGPITVVEQATGKRHIYEIRSADISRVSD